jgi:hypothetical protein
MISSAGGTQLRGDSCPYRKRLAFSPSAAPQAVTDAVASADPHPFLHEFYPELTLSQGEQPHPERAPPSASH